MLEIFGYQGKHFINVATSTSSLLETFDYHKKYLNNWGKLLITTGNTSSVLKAFNVTPNKAPSSCLKNYKAFPKTCFSFRMFWA